MPFPHVEARGRTKRAAEKGEKKQAQVPAAVRKLQPLAMNFFMVFVSFMIFGVRSEIPWTLLIFNAGFGAIAVMLSRGVRGQPETFLHKAARPCAITGYSSSSARGRAFRTFAVRSRTPRVPTCSCRTEM